jgi:hypothetical protein
MTFHHAGLPSGGQRIKFKQAFELEIHVPAG